MDQPLRIVSARFFPSGVSAGSRPDGGSTISVVCRCGVLGSVTPERRARPNSPFSISALLGSMRPAATSSACLYSASVRHALFMSHGPPRPPMALAHRSSGMPAACIMFSVAVMSGSPQGVRGCCQPLGVSMKWLASLGGPTMDWPYVVATKIVAAAAPSSTLRILSIIRYIVTPVAPVGRESPAAPSKVTCPIPQGQGPSEELVTPRRQSPQRLFHAGITESKSPVSGGGCRPCGPTHGSRGGARTNGRCDGRHSFAHLLSIHAARSAAPTASQTLAYAGELASAICGLCLK